MTSAGPTSRVSFVNPRSSLGIGSGVIGQWSCVNRWIRTKLRHPRPITSPVSRGWLGLGADVAGGARTTVTLLGVGGILGTSIPGVVAVEGASWRALQLVCQESKRGASHPTPRSRVGRMRAEARAIAGIAWRWAGAPRRRSCSPIRRRGQQYGCIRRSSVSALWRGRSARRPSAETPTSIFFAARGACPLSGRPRKWPGLGRHPDISGSVRGSARNRT